MAKKEKSHANVQKTKTPRPQKNMWNIVTVLAMIASFGLIAHLSFFGPGKFTNPSSKSASASANTADYESRVQLVASKFRCACGGCGELPLDECTCDMPRGAAEEKDFIRRELEKGRTIDQVIRAVDDKYGHRKT